MGGFGSGCRAAYAKKQTTDAALALDVRWLARHGLLAPGHHSVTWKGVLGESSIDFQAGHDALTLEYRTRSSPLEDWQEVREAVPLAHTACNFGGGRPWFVCPGCGRRVAVLYQVGVRFRCRHCHDLAYASTREGSWARTRRRADTLRLKLGGEPGLLGMLRPLPRPAGMSWGTYTRILQRLDELDAAWITSAAPPVGVLRKRLDGAPRD